MTKPDFLSQTTNQIKKTARPFAAGLAMFFSTASEAFSAPEPVSNDTLDTKNIAAGPLTSLFVANSEDNKTKRDPQAKKGQLYAPPGTFADLEHKAMLSDFIASITQRDVLVLTPKFFPPVTWDVAWFSNEEALGYAKEFQKVLSSIEGLEYDEPPLPDDHEMLNKEQIEQVQSYARLYSHIAKGNQTPPHVRNNKINDMPVIIMPDTKEALVEMLFLKTLSITDPVEQERFTKKWGEEAYLYVLFHELGHVQDWDVLCQRNKEARSVQDVVTSKYEARADSYALKALKAWAKDKNTDIDEDFLSIVESWRAINSVQNTYPFLEAIGYSGYEPYPSHNTNGAYDIEGNEFMLTPYHNNPIEVIAASKTVASHIFSAVYTIFRETGSTKPQVWQAIAGNDEYILPALQYLSDHDFFPEDGLEYQMVREYLDAKERFGAINKESDKFQSFYAKLESKAPIFMGSSKRNYIDSLKATLIEQLKYSCDNAKAPFENSGKKLEKGQHYYISKP